MAQNQYLPRGHQERPVRQEYYGPESGRRGWDDGVQDLYNYDQGNGPQQGWQQRSNGYEDYGGSRPYQQEGQWEDPYYQEQPRADPQGYGSPHGYYQGQPPGRSYHYDDRFQNGGQPRSHQARADYDLHPQRSSEKHRPPPVQVEKKKPRERILAQPVSPKEIAWDNPFPTFNPKKKGHKKNHSSLDKGMQKLDISGSRMNSRPNTSQSNRRRDESRPQTSHGQRRDDTQGFESPGIPPQQQPMSPVRKEPPRKGSDQPDRLYQASGRPGPTPLHPPSSGVPLRSFDSDIPPQQPYPSRSVTMPDRGVHGSFQRSTPETPMARPPPLDSLAPRFENHQAGPTDWPRQERPAEFPPAQKSRSHEPQLPYDANSGGQYMQDEYTVNQAPQNYQAHPPYDTHDAPQERGQEDIPNFDAMSPIAHERDEIHLNSNYPPNGQPPYQKKPYQALPPIKPPLDNRILRDDGDSRANQSPLGGLAFNPPVNGSRTPAGAHSQGGLSHRDYSEQWTDNSFSPQSASTQYSDRPQRGVSDDARFPVRNASRVDQQPRSAVDTRQYPLPSARDYQQSPIDHFQPVRPNTSHGANVQNQFHGPGQRPNAIPPNGYAQNDPQIAPGSRGPLGNPNYPPGPQQNPVRPSPNTYGNDQEQRPKTAGSARPPPVRYYGDERAGSDNQRPSNQPIVNGSLPNPDALPAHPVPVRPGLVNHSSSAPPQPDNSQARGQSGQESRAGQSVEASRPTPPVSVAELNSLQQAMKSNPSDYPVALKFAKKLVEAASVLSNEGGRADAKTTAKNRERYIFDAHKVVKRLVTAGYPDAMFYLADCHGQGLLGLAPDPKEAFQLYQSAAKLNHPPSAYRVAVCCEMGHEDGGGTRRDPQKAIQWYKRAATLGDTPAMYKMGMVLLKGLLGQPKNTREALPWLKRAAERADAENPHALHELGLLYESAAPNDHIIRDEHYAFQLFKQAADLGYKYAQFRLGSAYEYGLLGCQIDARQSIMWYTRAATQSEHQSELALSGWYLTGSEGILQQSDTEAYLWARKAAGSGLVKAEYAMGYFTEVGIGIAANLEEAKRWYYRAASQGFPKARERLETLKRGGQKMQRTRVSRSAVTKQNEGDCVVM